MSHHLQMFRRYTLLSKPVWTLTWRECMSMSIRSGVPPVRDEDTQFNKSIAKKCIEEFGPDLLEGIQTVIHHLSTKPTNRLSYVAKTAWGYSHKISTPEWQAMHYFLAIVNTVVRHTKQ